MTLTASINRAILDLRPRGWMRHLVNYANCDMLFPEIFEKEPDHQVRTLHTDCASNFHHIYH